MEKKKVYVVSCPETGMSKVHTHSVIAAMQLIAGDIENNPEDVEFNYCVQVKLMTDKQFNNLPEYNP